jgi:ABC-2 type transport system ATP-binding protein
MDNPIEIVKLTKAFGGQKAVDDLTLRIKPGQVFGFLGPNGAGKTTTIRTLLGITKPSEGTVRVLGEDLFRASPQWKRSIGFLSGDMPFYENLTGQQYLKFIDSMYGGGHGEQHAQLCDRLHAQLDKPIGKLSRGNKQKIGLVAALGHNPRLLILDEPTSGLDPVTQHAFGELIRERVTHGVTVFLSSHILSEVQELCDHVAFIRDGKLISSSSTRQLLTDQPKQIMVLFVSKDEAVKFMKSNIISNATLKETQVSGQTSANSNQLIADLVRYDIIDLRIELPDLEQIFMHYYEDAEIK